MLQVLVLVLLIVALPGAIMAHGGGGGGGGGHGGGGGGFGGGHGSASFGGGGGHFSGYSGGFSGGAAHFSSGAMHYSTGFSGASRSFAGPTSAGNFARSGNANFAHTGNSNFAHTGNANFAHTGNSNFARTGNQNWSHNNWSGNNNWHGNSNWHGNDGGHHDWDHHFTHDHFNSFGFGFGGWGWGWGLPFAWWWGAPYWGGYGGYYADYLCPYGAYTPYYASAYPDSGYAYDYGNDGQYAVGSPVDQNAVNVQQPPITDQSQTPPNAEQAGMEALQYYNEARTAFEQGNYRDALRLVGHSGIDSPQNPKVHELASLGLFASGDYKGAATEAHAALAFGTPSNWSDLYGYYNDVEKYTDQLRKLEKTVATVPNSAPGQFLLGYHYLMTGATAQAKEHFALASKLTPNDKLAQHIVKQLDSGGTVTPPDLPKLPPQGAEHPPQLPPVASPPSGQQL